MTRMRGKLGLTVIAATGLLLLAYVVRASPGGPAGERFEPLALLERYEAAVAEMASQTAAMARGADALAEAIVEGDAAFAVAGNASVRLDWVNRPGAMLGGAGRAAEAGDAVLAVIGSDGGSGGSLAAEVMQLQRLAEGGSVLVAVASVEALREAGVLDAVRRATAAVIDLGVGGDDPLRPALALTAAWAVQCEVFAACVRRRAVPVVRQSAEIDTRQDRRLRYGGQRFHHDLWLEPIAAGELAARYLERAGELSLDLRTASGDPLEAAARRSRSAARGGGTVWLSAGPRAVYAGRYLDAATGSMAMWTGVAGPDDLVIGVGEYDPPSWAWWREIDAMRDADAVFWVLASYAVRPGELGPGETLIDNQVPFGDAAIDVPGYDARVGPLSSVANELVLAVLNRAIVSIQ